MTITRQDVNRIHERLDEMSKSMGGMQTDMAVLQEACGPCKRSIATLKLSVYGNGDEERGLASRVILLERTALAGKRIFWRIFEPLLAALGSGGLVAYLLKQ